MKIVSKILFLLRLLWIVLTIDFVYLSYIIKSDFIYNWYNWGKIIVGIVMLLGTIMILLTLRRNLQLPDKLLKETGNIEKYVEIQKGLLNERLIFKNLYQIRMAVVEYYYGYFEESINLFRSVKKFPKKNDFDTLLLSSARLTFHRQFRSILLLVKPIDGLSRK